MIDISPRVRTLAATALAVLEVLAIFGPASAQTTAQSRFRLDPVRKQNLTLPVRGPEHTIYGRIAQLNAPYFTMRLRSGRVLTINARTAMERGSYSAPLFVGKFVMVRGKIDSSGAIQADNVTRQPPMDSTTALDR